MQRNREPELHRAEQLSPYVRALLESYASQLGTMGLWVSMHEHRPRFPLIQEGQARPLSAHEERLLLNAGHDISELLRVIGVEPAQVAALLEGLEADDSGSPPAS